MSHEAHIKTTLVDNLRYAAYARGEVIGSGDMEEANRQGSRAGLESSDRLLRRFIAALVREVPKEKYRKIVKEFRKLDDIRRARVMVKTGRMKPSYLTARLERYAKRTKSS